MCPYCKMQIRVVDKFCEGCGRFYIPKVSKNKTVLFLQEVNGNIIIPIGRI
jgi:hypothetical protein